MDEKKEAACKLKLVYWNIRGLAQPIRHLLEYLSLPYEDVHLPSDNPNNWFRGGFEEIRKKCLFPNLPYLDDDGFMISEPIAICKYLCRKSGREDLLGNTIEDKARVDELLAKHITHRNKLGELFRRDFLPTDANETAVKERLSQLFVEIMQNAYVPTVIKLLEHSEFLLGYLTLADFFAYESVFYLTGIYPEKMGQHEHVEQFKKRFEELPEIKHYNESERVMLKTFLNPVKGVWVGNPKFN